MPYGFDSRFSHHKKASTSVLAFFVHETNIEPSLCYAQIGFAFLTKIACSSLTRSWTKIAPLGAFPFQRSSTLVLAFFVLEIVIDPSLCYAQIGFAFLTKIACSSLTRSWTKTAPLGAFPFQRSSTSVLAFFVHEIKKKKAQFAPLLVNKKRCLIMLHFAKSISPAKDNSNSRNKADNADN